MDTEKIGVLGPKGRLGSALVLSGCSPIEVDITDIEALKEANLDRFQVLINCAAVTNVDGCQSDSGDPTEVYKKAVKVNVRGPEYIRNHFSGLLIHISTDYVFKCDVGPYAEDAYRDPVNDYGFTKLGGEIVLESNPFQLPTVVVRTTGLYGSGKDFANYVLHNLWREETILASSELYGNQTYIPHLCEALLVLSAKTDLQEFSYLHLASKDVISRYEFAIRLATVWGLQASRVFPVVSSQINNWVAPRPTKGGLLVNKAEEMGFPIYSIQEGLMDFYTREK